MHRRASVVLGHGNRIVSSRYSMVISDELDRELARVADESEQTKTDIFRKALHLYFVARDGKRDGLKVGLAKPGQELQTEFYGL